MVEPEKITIIEGPTPEFHQTTDFSLHSILEGPQDAINTFTEMRTGNGEDIRERCLRAWKEGRPVKLDFPDEMGLRREIDVVGLRLKEVDEGTVLQLWVRQQIDYQNAEDDSDDDEGFLDDFDDGTLPF